MKAGETPTKGNSTFAMTVLSHDPALETHTDDFIFYFKISLISGLLAGSLSAITPLHYAP